MKYWNGEYKKEEEIKILNKADVEILIFSAVTCNPYLYWSINSILSSN